MSDRDQSAASMTRDRALAVLEGEPKVIGFVRDGNHIVLILSFRGCDDDAFEIEADLSTVRFWLPRLDARDV